MRSAYALLFAANVVYATAYVATRLTLDTVPPSLLAFARLPLDERQRRHAHRAPHDRAGRHRRGAVAREHVAPDERV